MIQNNDGIEPKELGYGQLLKIFWRRRLLFFGMLAGVLSILVPYSLSKPEIYQSHMQLLLEPNYEGKEGLSEKKFADSNVEIDYATQRQVMLSSPLLQRAVDKLVPQYPDLDVFTLREFISLNRLVENDKVETKIFQVSYTGKDPQKTQRVLEVIREVYLEHNLEQQQKRLVDGLSFIDSQIPKARESVAQAEGELEQLRTKYRLIAPEQEASSLSAILKNTEKERDGLKAQYSAANSRVQELQKQLGLSAEDTKVASRLSQSSAYQNLFDEIQVLDAKIVERQAVLTDESPILQHLKAARNSKKAQLKQIATKVLGTLPSDADGTEFLAKKSQLIDSDSHYITALTEAQGDMIGIKEQERSLAASESELREQLTLFPEIMANYANLLQNIKAKRANLQRLLDAKQFLGIEINRGGFNWQVIEPPQLGIQIAPNRIKDLLLSSVIGLFAGVGAVLLREVSDTRVYSSKQIGERVALPFLGSTPGLSAAKDRQFFTNVPFLKTQKSSVAKIITWQPFRESIDLIYENLTMLYSHPELKSIAVTSAVTGEGKSTFVIGLALGIARHEKKVLIIDGDLRCPCLHENFGYTEVDSGLSNILKEENEILNIHSVDYCGEQIDFLSAGNENIDPVRLLNSPRFRQLIEKLENDYDLIVVDTPPAVGMVDAIKIASCCQGTIIVTRINKVKQHELQDVTASLARLNVLGIVANDSNETSNTLTAVKYRLNSSYRLNQSVDLLQK